MHVDLHAQLAPGSYVQITPVIKAPQLELITDCNVAFVHQSVHNRLQELQVHSEPSDSDISTFLNLSLYGGCGYDLRIYLLLGKRWMKPTTNCFVTCCWGELPQDQFYKKSVLAATERLPLPLLNKLSSTARQLFQADNHWLGYSLLDLQDKFCVGTYDYNVYPYKFHFRPGFQANFSMESAHTDPTIDMDTTKEEPSSKRLRHEHTNPEPVHTFKYGSAKVLQGSTGDSVLAASVAIPEELEMAEILEHLTTSMQGLSQDLKKTTPHETNSFPQLAFRRVYSKFKIPQAAGICKWATHLHLVLAPFNKEADLPGGTTTEGDCRYDSDEEYADFDDTQIHPTHKAVAMSALSAIVKLGDMPLADKATQQLLQQLPSWKISVQLQQQLEATASYCSSKQRSDVLQQAIPEEQSPAVTQSGCSLQPSATEPLVSGQQLAAQLPPLQDTYLLQVDMREVLGHGGTGTIFAGQYQGQDVAVKVTYPYYKAERGYCKDMRVLQEVWAYRQLQKIPEVYGSLVPALLAFARLPNNTFILVMTKQGQTLSSYMDEHGHIPSKDQLLSALEKLHSCGVIHGSPRFDNITLKPGSLDVCFIDLQRVRTRDYRWKPLFGRSTFSGVYDELAGRWRDANEAEVLHEGARSLTKQIMHFVVLRTKEVDYLNQLLEYDYSQDKSNCYSIQRSRFKVDY